MKYFLLPVDFSQVTDKQVDYLLTRIRDPQKTLVTLLHAAKPLNVSYVDDIGRAAILNRKSLKAKLATQANRIQERFPDVVVETQVREGDAAEIIRREVSGEPYDEIIIGSHGHGALYDFFVGSVANAALHSTRCNVHVIPSREPKLNRSGPVMAAINFSGNSGNQIRKAHDLAMEQGTNQLVLLHVVEMFPFDVFSGAEEIADARERYHGTMIGRIHEWAEDTLPSGHQMEIQPVVRFGSALKAVMEEVEGWRPSMLVLGANRHGPLTELLVGSLSRDVMNNVDIPTVFLPSHKPKALPGEHPSAEARLAVTKALPGVSRGQVNALIRHSTRINVQEGYPLDSVANNADVCHVIMAGRVAVQIDTDNGEPVEICRATAGDMVGFQWPLAGDEPSPVAPRITRAVALEPVTALRIDMDWLRTATTKNGIFAAAILRKFAESISVLLGAVPGERSLDGGPGDWSIGSLEEPALGTKHARGQMPVHTPAGFSEHR